VERQHGSETSPTAAPLSSSGPSRLPKSSPEESPRRGITRKRAASINTEEANRQKIENLSLTTPATASPRPFDGSNNLICLCTPAPKVPRPRNGMSSLLLPLLLAEGATYTRPLTCPFPSVLNPGTLAVSVVV
jgi:hypothetical protein